MEDLQVYLGRMSRQLQDMEEQHQVGAWQGCRSGLTPSGS